MEREAILIALEDEKSSRLYFEEIKKYLRNNRMLILADHDGSDPKSVVNAAKRVFDTRKKAAETDSYATPFEKCNVWIVFDTQEYQNPVRRLAAKNAPEQIRQLEFKSAISNPSFEFWLLLHFEYSVGPFTDGKAVLKKLAIHVKDYAKRVGCFEKTRSRLPSAVKHAKKIFAERGNGSNSACDVHPSTEIHTLMSELVPELVGTQEGEKLKGGPRKR